MKHDELDRLLAKADEIVPSSGFTAAVMDAVRREAAAPAPLAFPWRRAWPGILGAAVALVAVIVNGVETLLEGLQGLAPDSFERVFARVVDVATGNGVSGLAVLTLVLTLILVTGIPRWMSEHPLRERR